MVMLRDIVRGIINIFSFDLSNHLPILASLLSNKNTQIYAGKPYNLQDTYKADDKILYQQRYYCLSA